MTHGSVDFASHVLGLLQTSGPSGPTGPSTSKVFNSNDKGGTSRAHEVGPVEKEWSQPMQSSGPSKSPEKQSVARGGTTGTSGTNIFEGGPSQVEADRAPAEWHAVLAELERHSCPDWLTLDRWNAALSDSENFLTRWGAAAHSLGWTPLDLFGVHPLAPASRFDAMGLLLLIQGGAVVALTADGASIRRVSGAVLSYRRCMAPGGILLSELKS